MNLIRFIRTNNYIPLLIFAVSMGLLEAIVVVYIRELYYPEGFEFPLKELPKWLIVVEWTREITTLLMLGSVGWVSGKTFIKRLSVFLFLFGIWDITYYAGLKVFLNWPESLLTWDILFLIPITWVGPVLAPILCSILMIIISFIFDFLISKNKLHKLIPLEWILLIAGAAIIYYTYTVDFGMILIKGNFLDDFSNLAENPQFIKILTFWIPADYNWGLFALGFVVICIGTGYIVKRTSSVS
ncbi:MAG: hypothetical protein R2757_20925 [Draconibacterium sp.]